MTRTKEYKEELLQSFLGNEDLVKRIATVATEVAARVAAEEAIITYKKHEEAAKKEQRNKYVSNAKKILKSYKELSVYAGKLDNEVKKSVSKLMPEEEQKSLIQMLEFSDDIIATIKESKQKTIVMLQHVDKAMKTLEFMYKRENNIRYYRIITDLHLKAMKVEIVAEKYNMHPRSIFKVEEKVAERLAILLFGFYGIQIE